MPPQVRTAEGFDAASSAGLFVGVRHFDDEELSEVPFAVNDAVDLAHLFALELELIPPAQRKPARVGMRVHRGAGGRLRLFASPRSLPPLRTEGLW